MNKEQALKKIEELKEFIKQEDEVILVPDCIHIEKYGGFGGDGLGIKFNDDKQVLCYSENYGGQYTVDIAGDGGNKRANEVECKLVKITEEELKPGDTVYMSNYGLADRNFLQYYYKILPNNKHCYVARKKEITVYDCNYKDIYKVVPLD